MQDSCLRLWATGLRVQSLPLRLRVLHAQGARTSRIGGVMMSGLRVNILAKASRPSGASADGSLRRTWKLESRMLPSPTT